MTLLYYRLPSPLHSTSVSCSPSSRHLSFRLCISNICTLALHFLLLCLHNHTPRSILMSFPFLKNSHHISIRPARPARHLLGFYPSDFVSPIQALLILFCMLCCSHIHSLTSILIARFLLQTHITPRIDPRVLLAIFSEPCPSVFALRKDDRLVLQI